MTYPEENGTAQTRPIEKIVNNIVNACKPDHVFLLGRHENYYCSESIFNAAYPAKELYCNYYFLILLTDLNNSTVFKWQEKLEAQVSAPEQLTCIVLETATYCRWLKEGRFFSKMVAASATVLYQKEMVPLPLFDGEKYAAENSSRVKGYIASLPRINQFMASAGQLMQSDQVRVTAFVLHQAAEQILAGIISAGLGFNCTLHYLPRLIRYASLVDHEIGNLFSGVKNARLLHLLQKAYLHSRYRQHYEITSLQLEELFNKIKWLQELLLNMVPEEFLISPQQA